MLKAPAKFKQTYPPPPAPVSLLLNPHCSLIVKICSSTGCDTPIARNKLLLKDTSCSIFLK